MFTRIITSTDMQSQAEPTILENHITVYRSQQSVYNYQFNTENIIIICYHGNFVYSSKQPMYCNSIFLFLKGLRLNCVCWGGNFNCCIRLWLLKLLVLGDLQHKKTISRGTDYFAGWGQYSQCTKCSTWVYEPGTISSITQILTNF